MRKKKHLKPLLNILKSDQKRGKSTLEKGRNSELGPYLTSQKEKIDKIE